MLKHLIKKIRIALTPHFMDLKTTLSNGAIVLGKNRKGYGGRGVFIYGDAIEPELMHLDKFLEKDDLFIDIGASSGIYTVKAAKHVGNSGLVISIEPFPEVFNTLYKNIIRNNFTNVRLRNLVVTDKTVEKTLWMNSNSPNTFSIVSKRENSEGMSILGVSLDDLVKWENINRVDYIKIDAEGAEEAILSGATEIINKFRPIVQLEIIVNNVEVTFDSYKIFKAPDSLNIILIPEENSKTKVAKELGWKQLN
jgi:FkbM family methyltransferase